MAVDGGTRPAATGRVPEAWSDVLDGPPSLGREQGRARAGRGREPRRGRAAALLSGVLLLTLFAGDLAIALLLPVRTSTCVDRLCGPGLGVAAGTVGVALVALVVWMIGDVRRDRGRGTAWCWGAVALAALPWLLVTLPVRWW